jgi:hypothetical protein
MVVGVQADKIDYWDNVYGFDFKCIKSMAMAEPLVDVVDPQQVATTTATVRSMVCHCFAQACLNSFVCKGCSPSVSHLDVTHNQGWVIRTFETSHTD